MKKLKTGLCLLAALAVLLPVHITGAAQQSEHPVIDIDLSGNYTPISDNLFGIFFEDINYAADGGICANLIRNNSFEQKLAWHPEGDYRMTGWEVTSGETEISDESPLNDNNLNYIHFNSDSVIRNSGYPEDEKQNGIYLERNTVYDFSFYARNPDGKTAEVSVINENDKSTPVGSFELTAKFKKYTSSFSVTGTGYYCLEIKSKAGTDTDMYSLVSQNSFGYGDKTWKYSYLRKDLVSALKELNPSFMRFPGGCLAEGAYNWDFAYNWKETIGPLDQRKQIPNLWGYNQSRELGFYEYFCLCEYLGAAPVPVVHAGLMCQSRGSWTMPTDSEEFRNHIQDIKDLIEYANGSKETKWGAVRAENGHPEPFNMKYLAIGNENWMEDYWERFDIIYNEIKAVYPEIKIITSSGAWPDGNEFDYAWKQINSKYRDTIVDEHYYVATWWPYVNFERYDKYDRSGAKVFVGEYAVHRSGGEQITKNNLQVAVDEGVHMLSLVRNGDIVEMACYAPLFARNGYTQWAPNLIWFNSKEVVKTPSYYVQQLFMNNTGSAYVKSELSGKTDDVFQVTSINESKKQIYVSVVNASSEIKKCEINFNGVDNIDKTAEQRYVGSGLFNLANRLSPLNNLVTPRYRKVSVNNNTLTQNIPPHSVNIFCISYGGENTYSSLGSSSGYKPGSSAEDIFLKLLADFIVWFTETDFYHTVSDIFKKQ